MSVHSWTSDGEQNTPNRVARQPEWPLSVQHLVRRVLIIHKSVLIRAIRENPRNLGMPANPRNPRNPRMHLSATSPFGNPRNQLPESRQGNVEQPLLASGLLPLHHDGTLMRAVDEGAAADDFSIGDEQAH